MFLIKEVSRYFPFIGLIAVTLLLSLLQNVHAEKISSHSFTPPFEEIDTSGQRMVQHGWRVSGSTVVNNNFARLTPDLQSKRGAIWSREPLDVPSFSAVLKFRISGKGKDLFGDGMAVWLVQQGYYIEGDLHGFQDDFIGVGILFDTFKNTEHPEAHKDVTILINDGEKTWEMMTETVLGCTTQVRYHTERADFRATDASALKITVSNRALMVEIDARNNGHWSTCVDLHDIQLPEHWTVDSHIGITASTGQLSDNHDVISLDTYVDKAVLEQAEYEKTRRVLFEIAPHNMTEIDRVQRLEEALNKILNKMEYMEHHFEHHFVTNSDNIDHVKAKLDAREDSAMNKIGELEVLVKKEVGVTLGHRINSLESSLKAKMDHKIIQFEDTVGTMMSRPEWKGKKLSSSGESWKLPFLLLLVLLVGGCGGVYYFYQKLLRKMHLP